jgi:Zn finger protein HypA/HybF involved in hydrogenase expression
MDAVLLEAWCRACSLGFDLWAETDGELYRVEPHYLRCPNCLSVVRADDLQEKESLS